MPISREIECSSYEEIEITMEDIAEEIDEKDTIKLIKLLIEKYPNATNLLLNENKGHPKLFPESIKTELIKKYQSENKTLNEFIKS